MLTEIRSFIFIVIVSIVLTSCGGSDDSGTGPSAKVTEENAVVLAREAYFGGFTDESDFLFKKNSVNDNTIDTIKMRSLSAVEHYLNPATKASYSETINGSCSGTNTITLTENSPSTITISNSMAQFNDNDDNCSSGPTMNGTMDIVANYIETGPDDIEITSMTIRFNNTQVSEPGFTGNYNGSMTLSMPNDYSAQATLNMTITNSSNDIQLKYVNYKRIANESYDGVSETISGIYDNSQFGSVSISTPLQILTVYGDTYPSSGILAITGTSGEFGPTQANLYFESSTTYSVSWDSDGDGTFDGDSGILYW